MNACFISYRHPGNKRTTEILRKLADELEARICLHVPGARAYFDLERLEVGDRYQEELATELCRSACMVLFFNRSYFDVTNHFCAREYRAMIELEKRRLGSAASDLQRKGLILTVAIRDPENLPAEITAHRQFVDVSGLMLSPNYFKQTKWLTKLDEIAKAVADRYSIVSKALGATPDNCPDFRLPPFSDIESWLRGVVDSYPPVTMPGH